MPIGDICVRDVVVASRDTKITAACRLMREHHVGNIVVVDEFNGRPCPIGIITDRDIVVGVLALDLEPTNFALGDLVWQDLVCLRENQGIFESIRDMRINGVRRAPVVDDEGSLVGIVSVDDLLQLLSSEMDQLAKLISKAPTREAQIRGHL